VVIDSSHVRGEGRPKTGPSPVDRARPGSGHHVITEGNGIPLAVSLTGGNRSDITQLMPLIAAIPPVRGRRGRPRRRPDSLYADRGYDHDKYRRQVCEKGITPAIARRGSEHGSGPGVHGWVVVQSIALLHSLIRAHDRPAARPVRHRQTGSPPPATSSSSKATLTAAASAPPPVDDPPQRHHDAHVTRPGGPSVVASRWSHLAGG
jgi:hypothetical protein